MRLRWNRKRRLPIDWGYSIPGDAVATGPRAVMIGKDAVAVGSAAGIWIRPCNCAEANKCDRGRCYTRQG